MWFSTLKTAAVAGALASTVNAFPQTSSNGNGHRTRATACNNSPSLCDRKYSNVTYLGAHNSYALRDESTNDSISGNQYYNATRALDAGLRMLQVQTNEGNSSLELCHTSCDLLDGGSLEAFLVKINDWMDDNPNEVVTMVAVNSDSKDPSEFNTAMESSGISKKTWTSDTGVAPTEWPTLQTMIDNDTRFVMFVTNIKFDSSYPGVLPEFKFMFETPYDVTTISGFNCTADRPSRFDGEASTAVADGYLSLLNHFKYSGASSIIQIPDMDALDTVNSNSTTETGALGTHLEQCNKEWGVQPNFVLVDFWNEGEALSAVDNMNNVTDATGRTATAQGSADADSTDAAGRVGVEYGALVAFFLGAVLLV